jgi:hypothetical protein
MPDEKKAKATVKTSKKSWIPPLLDNFKRTKKGQQLIRQELMVLLQEESKMFPHKSMFNVDRTKVRYSEHGQVQEISVDALMERAPRFFSVYYATVRRKIDYGLKVQQWLKLVSRFFGILFFSKKRDVLFFCFVPFLEEDAQKPPKKNMALEAMRTMKDDGSTRELNGLVAQIVAIGSNPGGEIAEESENASD